LSDWDIVYDPDEHPDEENLAEIWYDFRVHAATVVLSRQVDSRNIEPILAHELAHARMMEFRSLASSVKGLISDDAGKEFFWDLYTKTEERAAERLAELAVECESYRHAISKASRRTGKA
jgi:hypothetical protein